MSIDSQKVHAPDSEGYLAVHPEPLGAVCRTNAHEHANEPALITSSSTVTWGDLYSRACQVARGLADLGISRGDRVAVLSKPSPSLFEIIHAIPLVGAVHVPVNWRLSAREIRHVLQDSQTRVAFVGSDFLRMEIGLETIDSLKHIVCTDDESEDTRFIAFDEWKSTYDASSIDRPLQGSDIAIQMYTSGTTGRPKGALLSNNYLTEYARMPTLQEEDIWGLKSGEIPLAYTPLFHLSGIAAHFHPAVRGVGTVLLDGFDPGRVLSLSREYSSPKISGVSTVLQSILNYIEQHDIDPPQFRYCVYGSDPMPPTLRQRLMATFNCRFSQYYGMTESALVTQLTPEDHMRDAADPVMLSVGSPMPGVELTIRDHDGVELPPHSVGEIVIRSTTLADGYWELPQATAEVFKDGWYHSGDAGYVDENGYLFLKDRIKDMIKSGGENIYPAEIENVLDSHPFVERTAVVGKPDEHWGEVPHAFIAMRSGQSVSEEDLRHFLKDRLAKYKQPKSYTFLQDMPLGPSGKILKTELRKISDKEGTS